MMVGLTLRGLYLKHYFVDWCFVQTHRQQILELEAVCFKDDFNLMKGTLSSMKSFDEFWCYTVSNYLYIA